MHLIDRVLENGSHEYYSVYTGKKVSIDFGLKINGKCPKCGSSRLNSVNGYPYCSEGGCGWCFDSRVTINGEKTMLDIGCTIYDSIVKEIMRTK